MGNQNIKLMDIKDFDIPVYLFMMKYYLIELSLFPRVYLHFHIHFYKAFVFSIRPLINIKSDYYFRIL